MESKETEFNAGSKNNKGQCTPGPTATTVQSSKQRKPNGL